MDVSYDGTDYFGWQEQPDKITVCGVLKNRFERVFKIPVSIVAASRTDAGVHAQGQVVRTRTELDLDAKQLKEVLSRVLPEDIVLHDVQRVDTSFHPQRNIQEKIYRYRIFTMRPSVFEQRFGYYYNYGMDEQKLLDALQVFVGTHDFRSFCTGYEMKSTVRTINAITIESFSTATTKGYDIFFIGESFLKYMIRRLVGAAIETSTRQGLTIENLQSVLAQKNPEQSLPTAPAKGLTLLSIEYKGE